MPSLTDGVVVLREFVAGDAVALAAIWSDPSTLRASYLTPAGQALDQHVFGLLPEDLALHLDISIDELLERSREAEPVRA